MGEDSVGLSGYSIERSLGDGGFGELFLAVQRRTGRRVALRRIRPELAQTPDFRTLFATECRLCARLAHPHIAPLLEAIAEGGELAIVTEYLDGGDLHHRLKQGMHLSMAIAIIVDLARALDHAHNQGAVHGDVSPGNILFRNPDTAVLVNFGKARLTELAWKATGRSGTWGDPACWSPEQRASGVVDARSDLYNLGGVLYQVLTGDVPFQADASGKVVSGPQHDPVPRLPMHLAIFQPVIDRLLARRPEQRFRSGLEVAEALEQIRQAGAIPGITIHTEAVTPAEIRAVGESVLVTFKDPRRAVERSRRRQRQRLAAWSLVATIVFFGVIAGSYWLVTHPEKLQSLLAQAGLAEKPGLGDAWNEAQSLRQDRNQGLRTLVAAYERVLLIDPQHAGAREGMASLADEWKETVAGALQTGNFSAAQSWLTEARLAFPEDSEFDRLLGELEDRRNAEALLASTRALLQSHGVADAPSATAAIQAFNEVLRLAPGHPVALQELASIARYYAGLAADRVASGDIQAAIGHLDRASTASPLLPEIAAIRQSIQQATTTLETIAQFLEAARAFRESGALVAPTEGNAAALYHQVLSIDPGNTIARQGLDEVVARLREQVARRLEAGDFAAVADVITQASAVNLDPLAVEAFRRQLVTQQTRVATLNRLLAQARRFLAEGYLTAPETGNATLSLREVQRIDPGNAEASVLLREVAERLAAVAKEARAARLHREAQEYLDLALAIVPGVPEWQTLREEWSRNVNGGG